MKALRPIVLAGCAALMLLSWAYARLFTGLQGDGLLYYAVAVSVVWDGDLDLRNQYEAPLPGRPGATVAGGQFFVDPTTGKAFTLFNPGAGLAMVPALAVTRTVDALRRRPDQEPFSLYYQRRAAYSSVVMTTAALCLLWLLLSRWLPARAAFVLPLAFLLGTNWAFYTVVHAGWAHVPALFWTVLLVWAAVAWTERHRWREAAWFGIAAGALFTTRNLGAVTAIVVAAWVVAHELRRRNERPTAWRSDIVAASLAGAGALLCAAPQVLLNAFQHGSPFRASVAATVDAVKPFGFPGGAPGPVPYVPPTGVGAFEPVSLGNLAYLVSNLVNLENGLFVWHPLLFVGVMGAVLLRSPRQTLGGATACLGVSACVLWLVDAAYFDTWFSRAAGSGFGERRFLDLLPFFVLGTAQVWLWAAQRRTRWLAVAAIVISMAWGIGLLLGVVDQYAHVREASDSYVALAAFAMGDWRAWLVALTLGVGLVASRLPDPDQAARARHPWMVAVIAAAILLPVVFFRATPEWERQRVRERRGFLAVYSPVPYVRLLSREWGDADDGGRELRRSPAAVGLPAPLEPGDALLLRMRVDTAHTTARALEVRLGDEVVGREGLTGGDRVYSFPVTRRFAKPKAVGLSVSPFAAQTGRESGVRLVEARILLKGADDPPFGMIGSPGCDRLRLDEPATIEGWVLDDRGIAGVFAQVEGRETPIPATFSDQPWPDVTSVFKLYAGHERNWWRVRLSPADLHSVVGGARINVIAEDRSGHRSNIGACRMAVR